MTITFDMAPYGSDDLVLAIDDEPANVRLVERILGQAGFTNICTTTDPRDGLRRITEDEPDIVLLDLHMPHIDGFEVLLQAQALADPDTLLPILVLTADSTPTTKRRALSLGATDFLTKPFDAIELVLRIHNLLAWRKLHAQVRQQNQILDERVRERTRELEASRLEVLERLGTAAEYRDDETGQHARRVARTVGLLAEALGVDEVELLLRAAPLHDVGKIGVTDAILLKPGRLTDEEREVMRQHTVIGARILSGGTSRTLQLAELIALTHHERWDGQGYPHGVAGEDIPICGRLLAVADVFDALTHRRPYKDPWPVDRAIAEIRANAGAQFDPEVVDAFETIAAEADLVADPD